MYTRKHEKRGKLQLEKFIHRERNVIQSQHERKEKRKIIEIIFPSTQYLRCGRRKRRNRMKR